MARQTKILIIEDDESIVEALQIALESVGLKTEALLRVDQVVPQIVKIEPQLILLDLLLSGKNGSEIAGELKKDSSTSHIPIIMLSAHPSAKQIALASGADDFLAKPFDISQLYALVSKYSSFKIS